MAYTKCSFAFLAVKDFAALYALHTGLS